MLDQILNISKSKIPRPSVAFENRRRYTVFYSSSYIPEFQLESKERRSIGVIGNISKTWMFKEESFILIFDILSVRVKSKVDGH